MSLREAVRNLLVLEHPEYVPILGRTKTTKKLLDCEKMLGSYFQKLFKIIDKNDMSVLASQQQFGNELHDKVLDCIQRSYFIGQDYVAKATKSTVALTVNDVKIIQSTTADIEDRFWKLIQQSRYIFVVNNMLAFTLKLHVCTFQVKLCHGFHFLFLSLVKYCCSGYFDACKFVDVHIAEYRNQLY